jgi:hypothetical protein
VVKKERESMRMGDKRVREGEVSERERERERERGRMRGNVELERERLRTLWNSKENPFIFEGGVVSCGQARNE